MKKLMTIAALLAVFTLSACMGLTPAQESRLAALETKNVQNTLTPEEREELHQLRLQAAEGGIDWDRLLELLATFGASVFATNSYRNHQRKKRNEPF